MKWPSKRSFEDCSATRKRNKEKETQNADWRLVAVSRLGSRGQDFRKFWGENAVHKQTTKIHQNINYDHLFSLSHHSEKMNFQFSQQKKMQVPHPHCRPASPSRFLISTNSWFRFDGFSFSLHCALLSDACESAPSPPGKKIRRGDQNIEEPKS